MGVSCFWSDQSDSKPQIVGHLAPQNTTVIRGATGDGQSTVFYYGFYYGQVRLMAVDSIDRPDDQMIAGRA